MNNLINKLSSITVLRGAKESHSIKTLTKLLMSQTSEDFYKNYSNLLSLLLVKPFSEILTEEIMYDSNIFTDNLDNITTPIKEAVNFDLECLSDVCSLTAEDILERAHKKFANDFILTLPKFESKNNFIITNSNRLRDLYKTNGFGKFSKNYAFILDGNEFKEVKSQDPIRLSDLKGYERQKEAIIQNTLSLLDGKLANNILLYGDKGTGKSSSVKAILNEYNKKGLKLIELKTTQIESFGKICEEISKSPFKFIIFLDDINFSSQDNNFNSLKAFIEGGITARPQNAVIYATSNRRHMVSEKFSDREGDEVHLRDALQSSTSLFDRFGIEILFSNPEKDEYLQIVDILADEYKVKMPKDDLFLLAERFALVKGGRSPRGARQFIYDCLQKQ